MRRVLTTPLSSKKKGLDLLSKAWRMKLSSSWGNGKFWGQLVEAIFTLPLYTRTFSLYVGSHHKPCNWWLSIDRLLKANWEVCIRFLVSWGGWEKRVVWWLHEGFLEKCGMVWCRMFGEDWVSVWLKEGANEITSVQEDTPELGSSLLVDSVLGGLIHCTCVCMHTRVHTHVRTWGVRHS